MQSSTQVLNSFSVNTTSKIIKYIIRSCICLFFKTVQILTKSPTPISDFNLTFISSQCDTHCRLESFLCTSNKENRNSVCCYKAVQLRRLSYLTGDQIFNTAFQCTFNDKRGELIEISCSLTPLILPPLIMSKRCFSCLCYNVSLTPSEQQQITPI